MATTLAIGPEQLSNSKSPCHPDASIKFWLNLTVWEEMQFEEFQDCGHLGFWNRTILAILNFHKTPMPPIKFKLNQTYRSGADVMAMVAILDIRTEPF